MSNKTITNAAIIESLKMTKGMVYLAAKNLGCTPQTIYNRAKRVVSVQDELDAQRGVVLDTAELKLWQAINNGESWAIAFILKTIGKHRGYTERTEIAGANDAPVRLVVEYVNDWHEDDTTSESTSGATGDPE